MKRREVYENIFSARALFIAGLLIIPSLLFNQVTEYRIAQFIFFMFLAWLSGKKINFFFTVMVIAVIVAFNLIVPYGRVLFSAGAFKITSGALKAGIHRAATFEALVMLSKASIRQDLRIPGAFGEILGESLRIFSAMTDRKIRITGKTFFADIDSLLLELSGKEFPDCAGAVQEKRTKAAGYVILAAAVVFSWLFWAVRFI